MRSILIFGNGYVSNFLSKELIDLGWFIYCTSRQKSSEQKTECQNIKIVNFFDPDLPKIIKSVNAILSTAPTDGKDPILAQYSRMISQSKSEWIGYLSSTSVYGNHDGSWVDEKTKCQPSNLKSETRLLAEQKWLELYYQHKMPIHILRLSGIYGPGRNCLEEINNGKDSTIVKKDQYFSRIHIVDICQAIIASLNSPTPGEVYNISDDEPAPMNVVQQFGANILNKKPLKELLFEKIDLSQPLSAFFNDSKKVSNDKITKTLNIKWKYPNYRIGLLHGCLPYLHN